MCIETILTPIKDKYEINKQIKNRPELYHLIKYIVVQFYYATNRLRREIKVDKVQKYQRLVSLSPGHHLQIFWAIHSNTWRFSLQEYWLLGYPFAESYAGIEVEPNSHVDLCIYLLVIFFENKKPHFL